MSCRPVRSRLVHAIEASGVGKTYGGRVVLDDVSFTVAPGEVFALLGPNGAGKTTTVETLEGYRVPDRGLVRVLGLDPRRQRRSLRHRIGVVLQEGGVAPALRVAEALRLFAGYYRDPVPPETLLDRLGLVPVARSFVRRLSGGERQRLNLALALVGRPEVLFLDEPTAGMDPHGRTAAWSVVEEARAQGVGVLLTTHSMEEAEALADRVGIIDHGRLVAVGSVRDITADASAEETRFRTRPGLDLASLAAALGLPPDALAELRPGEYRVAAPPAPELVAELAAWLRDEGVTLGDLHATRRPLEEVFLRLTGEDSTAAEERA